MMLSICHLIINKIRSKWEFYFLKNIIKAERDRYIIVSRKDDSELIKYRHDFQHLCLKFLK
jgi:hypothetical protein